MSNEALILIETQNEWLAEDGKLRDYIEDTELFDQSAINLERVLSYARSVDINIVHVGLRFAQSYPEMGEAQMGLRSAIPEAGTFPEDGDGSDFYEPLKPIEGEFVATGRNGSSGFAGSNLDTYLRNNQIDTLYLTGYAMHVCVESTLREAHDKGYNTFLISDATAAFSKEQKMHVLKHVVHHFGKSITTNEFKELLNQRTMPTAG